jgi:hypothetical protein
MGVGADFNEEEYRQAKRDGATLRKNSGRGQRKGDAQLGDYLLDYKFTEKGSYALNFEAFEKHAKDAWSERLEPIVVVCPGAKRNYAIIDWEHLKELMEYKYMYEGLCK